MSPIRKGIIAAAVSLAPSLVFAQIHDMLNYENYTAESV
jgi:hypothetical protein